MKKIVILSGWKGSGKDTVANFLSNELDYKRIAFADFLKDIVARQYNIPRHYFDDRILKESPLLSLPVCPRDSSGEHLSSLFLEEFRTKYGNKRIDNSEQLYWTPRALCIFEGSVKRTVSPDYWVLSAIKGISKNKNYVVSDSRFSSEINYIKNNIKSHQVIAVRVTRFDSVDTNDPSERDLDNYKFDLTIQNRGSLSELQETIKKELI
jgi:hypothetical protein